MTKAFFIWWFSLFVVSYHVLSLDISDAESQLAELKEDTTKRPPIL
jgi:hypothetical protein